MFTDTHRQACTKLTRLQNTCYRSFEIEPMCSTSSPVPFARPPSFGRVHGVQTPLLPVEQGSSSLIIVGTSSREFTKWRKVDEPSAPFLRQVTVVLWFLFLVRVSTPRRNGPSFILLKLFDQQ